VKSVFSKIFSKATLSVIIVLLLGGIGYGVYMYRELFFTNKSLEAKIAELEQTIKIYDESLLRSQDENTRLNSELEAKKAELEGLGADIENIQSTVSDLDKLSKLDPELLQKYSKVYFLNENYVPDKLSEINEKYIYASADKPQKIQSKIEPFLEDLLNDASDDGISLQITSAFRSFYDQQSLKSGYVVWYGSGANQFSADQGYSEHQLGTTVDLTTPSIATAYSGFENTTAYTWLLENAYRYGFVLSYPMGNAYYQFEPWHWRFVGTDLARYLHREGKYFYDMDQREIDKYLISIFD
jgi:D-alanyl-D-alanine carboxypeptidase